MKTSAVIIASIFLLFFNTNCSQNTEPKGDEKDQFLLSQTGPQFSSDGKKIVFEGLYDSVYAVHFVDISGNYLGYILNKKGFLSSPTWSPDNKKIAISIEGNLYTVKINGDSLTKLTNTGEDFFCNWSPDGRYIAYTKSICDPECGIMLYDFSNNSASIKTQFGSYASWDNNSERVYYRTNLYEKNTNTGIADYKGFVFRRKNVETNIEDSLYHVDDKNLMLTDCTVSPDEKEILFAASYGAPPIINIWKINLQKGEMIQMTFDGGNCPAYNPAGDKIVYTNTNIKEGGLWIMNRDGSNKQQLTKLRE
ncbi:MAG: TolB family protein [Melioribacteraceae bacterium]